MNRLILLENSKTNFGSLHRELEEKGLQEFRVFTSMKDFIEHCYQKKKDTYLVVIDSLLPDFSMETLQHLKQKFPDNYLLLLHNSDDHAQQQIAQEVCVHESVLKSSNSAEFIKNLLESLKQPV
jgi:DNA-binding NarL/FixJ family response regulator